MKAARILLVAAHPDDETIGAASQLAHWHNRVTILHATNGSPGNNRAYALARRRELLDAVRLAGIEAGQCHELGFVDQESSFHLEALARGIADWVWRIRPEIVLTHPYEGGHPDHDSCAFAVRAAAQLSGIGEVWEFASYHAGPRGAIETGVFLGSTHAAEVHRLSTDQQHMKRRMFRAFATQQEILNAFSLETEQFRPAPQYAFLDTPHRGALYYEQFDWGMTGSKWRELAAAAMQTLGRELHASHRP